MTDQFNQGMPAAHLMPTHGCNYGLTSIKEREKYLNSKKNISFQRFGSLAGSNYRSREIKEKLLQEKTRMSLQPHGSGKKSLKIEGIRNSLHKMSPKEITKMFFDGTIESPSKSVYKVKKKEQPLKSHESKISELPMAERTKRLET